MNQPPFLRLVSFCPRTAQKKREEYEGKGIETGKTGKVTSRFVEPWPVDRRQTTMTVTLSDMIPVRCSWGDDIDGVFLFHVLRSIYTRAAADWVGMKSGFCLRLGIDRNLQ
ncbi:Protein CBG22998 [Anopheles sinensis]|uniref:Protein CBG22998 n=1 Tax=Anopheles sinensis TaxID=74873 RepID=A0A084VW62_ANOSI|nr:Protein CBG22998 [Anopheles sinensis]